MVAKSPDIQKGLWLGPELGGSTGGSLGFPLQIVPCLELRTCWVVKHLPGGTLIYIVDFPPYRAVSFRGAVILDEPFNSNDLNRPSTSPHVIFRLFREMEGFLE